jgi:hypothetical protein
VIGPSVFVPMTSPVGESIVNTASKVSTDPKGVPFASKDWGPIVAVPTSVNVPVYGPEASPDELNEIVEVPLALHVAVMAGAGSKSSSPLSVGGETSANAALPVKARTATPAASTSSGKDLRFMLPSLLMTPRRLSHAALARATVRY